MARCSEGEHDGQGNNQPSVIAPNRNSGVGSHSRIEWPADFSFRFAVFIDVEEEFDWRRPPDRSARSTRAMTAFPSMHRRLVERGVAPICMIDYPIATDPASIDLLSCVAEDPRSAIGTQLHPWVNPPYAIESAPGDSFAGNLPIALEEAKLRLLTDTIESGFRTRPLIYRAGRYGIGPNTPMLLANLGYRIDSSVRARYDYRADGGPDFRDHDAHARQSGPIVELPLTTMFVGHAGAQGPALYNGSGRFLRSFMARTGLLERIALTPEGMPIDRAIAAVDAALAEDVRLLIFSFHSPSLQPGNTPYVRTTGDLQRFHYWWTQMLDALERRGIRNASLNEILTTLDK